MASAGPCAGGRASHSAASTNATSSPLFAQTRTRSPSRSLASAPPNFASGDTWIAAGTLPEAPDIRPSVTSATRKPLSWSTPSNGVSLCSSGIPLAAGPWNRTTTTTLRSSSPAWNAVITSFCSQNTRQGASIVQRDFSTALTLIVPRPRLPCTSRNPPSGWNGSLTGRSMAGLALVAGAGFQYRVSPSSRGCCAP